MLEVIGALLVVGAGQMAGMRLARQFRSRTEELRSLQSALLFLQTEISYTATPLPEALARVARTVSFPIKGLFLDTSSLLAGRSGITASEAWEHSLKRYKNWSALKTVDISILQSLGEALGTCSREEQVKHLLLAREQLRQEEIKAENERVRYEPMYRYSGLLVGLLVVIVLL